MKWVLSGRLCGVLETLTSLVGASFLYPYFLGVYLFVLFCFLCDWSLCFGLLCGGAALSFCHPAAVLSPQLLLSLLTGYM